MRSIPTLMPWNGAMPMSWWTLGGAARTSPSTLTVNRQRSPRSAAAASTTTCSPRVRGPASLPWSTPYSL